MSPPEPIKGIRGLFDWLNHLRAYAISRTVLRSETCDVHETDRGIQPLPIFPLGARGAGVASVVNFACLKSGTEGSIRVRQGILHTSTGPIIPVGMSEGDDPPYILEGVVGPTAVVKIVTVTPSTSEVTSVTIGTMAIESAVNTETTGYCVLGTVSAEGAVTGAIGDQAYLYCGGSHYFWRV